MFLGLAPCTFVMDWIGIVVTFAALLIVARKSLWVGLLVSAGLVGAFYLPLKEIFPIVTETLIDPSIFSLALAVGVIAFIGGAMERTGLIADLVDNLRIGKKLFLISGPALIGMLPVPGGAILSAPIVDKAGGDLQVNKKFAINVWFRHALTMIYPLASLLPATKMASVNLYVVMVYMVPVVLLVVFLGYVFFLSGIKDKTIYAEEFKPFKLFVPLAIILSAPIIHMTFYLLASGAIRTFALLIGVGVSLILTIWAGKMRMKDIVSVFRRMRPWRYALIILAIFIFMNIFKATGAASIIARIPANKAVFVVVLGGLLGLITGRVAVPISIMVPVLEAKYGVQIMTPVSFVIMYLAIFMGYIISPLHPCVTVTMEYFGVGFKEFFKELFWPTAIALVVAMAASLMLIR